MKSSQGVPMFWEENIDEEIDKVKFITKSKDKIIFFYEDEMVIAIAKNEEKNSSKKVKEIDTINKYFDLDNLKISFNGCNENVELYGEKSTYEKIVYQELYDNIDLKYLSIN